MASVLSVVERLFLLTLVGHSHQVLGGPLFFGLLLEHAAALFWRLFLDPVLFLGRFGHWRGPANHIGHREVGHQCFLCGNLPLMFSWTNLPIEWSGFPSP